MLIMTYTYKARSFSEMLFDKESDSKFTCIDVKESQAKLTKCVLIGPEIMSIYLYIYIMLKLNYQ